MTRQSRPPTVPMVDQKHRISTRVYGGIDLSQPPNPLLGYLTPRDVFNPRQIQYGLKLRF